MKVDLQIGDEVKVIPPSYYALSKGFFLYPECWSESNPETDKVIMLGGEYPILSKSEQPNSDFLVLLKNAENFRGHVHPSFLVRKANVTYCKYNIGDLVSFNPTCDDNDRKTLHRTFDNVFSFNDPNQVLRVSHVVNRYYIFLEKPNGEEYRWPFRWVDFIDAKSRDL